jgi:hypothetical protein
MNEKNMITVEECAGQPLKSVTGILIQYSLVQFSGINSLKAVH